MPPSIVDWFLSASVRIEVEFWRLFGPEDVRNFGSEWLDLSMEQRRGLDCFCSLEPSAYQRIFSNFQARLLHGFPALRSSWI